MSPLVALMLFGFMFVIALSLTLWAALTLGDGRHRVEHDDSEVAYVPLSAPRPVWRREDNDSKEPQGIERRKGSTRDDVAGRRRTDVTARRTGLPTVEAAEPPTKVDTPSRSNKGNDEYRGARATVIQRPNNDDAFERFLENERD